MSSMPRYIDADALLQKLPDDLHYKGSVKRVLMQAPEVDAVEVVRCKDCAFYLTMGDEYTFRGRKGRHCIWHQRLMKDTGYCDEGIRRNTLGEYEAEGVRIKIAKKFVEEAQSENT